MKNEIVESTLKKLNGYSYKEDHKILNADTSMLDDVYYHGSPENLNNTEEENQEQYRIMEAAMEKEITNINEIDKIVDEVMKDHDPSIYPHDITPSKEWIERQQERMKSGETFF